MIWIQIQFSSFSKILKFTQTLRTSKAKRLIRHFLLRIYTDVVMKATNNLNIAKSCQMNDIPTRVIKMNKDIQARN